MAGLSKSEQAKKPGKKASLHTEPVHDLAPMVDWEEQERIKRSLRSKYLPPVPGDRGVKASAYTPERGAMLCILRRQGKSGRQICASEHIKYDTIKKWLSDYPEFSQEWNDAHADYILDMAEELVPRAERLMEDLRLDGRKLSPKQHGRYLKSLMVLADTVKWSASHRVPAFYGDTDGGMELVLIQPTIPERNVTQDIPRARLWREESVAGEDGGEGAGEAGVPAPAGADGDGGGGGGQDNSGGSGPGDADTEDPVPAPKRRYKVGGRPLLKRSQRLADAGKGPGVD